MPPASPAAPNTSAPCVPLTVTVSAAPSPPPFGPAQVEVGPRHVGAGQVADDDVVGAAEGAEVDVLDVVEVHRHVGDVADEHGRARRWRRCRCSRRCSRRRRASCRCRPGPRACRCRRPGSTGRRRRRRPSRARSLPLSPKTKSSPSPPRSVSAPCEPRSVSSPVPPSIVSLMTPAGSVVAVTPSSPPSALTTSASLAPSELVMFTWAASPTTRGRRPGAERCRRRRRRSCR